jgi:hypothetical protein
MGLTLSERVALHQISPALNRRKYGVGGCCSFFANKRYTAPQFLWRFADNV